MDKKNLLEGRNSYFAVFVLFCFQAAIVLLLLFLLHNTSLKRNQMESNPASLYGRVTCMKVALLFPLEYDWKILVSLTAITSLFIELEGIWNFL